MESDKKSFAGRVVLVTGGSRGIGFATARAFLEHGARVAFCAQDGRRLQEAEKNLSALGTVAAIEADVRDRAQGLNLVQECRRQLGEIDVLINNAGRAWSGPFAGQPPEKIDEVLDANVKGVLYVTRAVLPHMLARGAGVIINVASGAGLAGFAGLAVYCASKFAVVGFTESLALEVTAHGIRVYAVCPGRVDTDMQREYSGKRMGMPPARVAHEVLRLAAGQARVRPGSCLEIPN